MKYLIRFLLFSISAMIFACCDNSQSAPLVRHSIACNQRMYDSCFTEAAEIYTSAQEYVCHNILHVKFDSQLSVFGFIEKLNLNQIEVLKDYSKSVCVSRSESAENPFSMQEESLIYDIASQYFVRKVEIENTTIYDFISPEMPSNVINYLVKVSAWYDYLIEDVVNTYNQTYSRTSFNECEGMFAIDVGSIAVGATIESEFTVLDAVVSLGELGIAYADYRDCLKAREMRERTHP